MDIIEFVSYHEAVMEEELDKVPISRSLVSLVVLGIFGRNTGFGPSMSLSRENLICKIYVSQYINKNLT